MWQLMGLQPFYKFNLQPLITSCFPRLLSGTQWWWSWPASWLTNWETAVSVHVSNVLMAPRTMFFHDWVAYHTKSILCPPLSAVGVFLFSFLCVLGSSLFALGSHFKGTPYLLPLMLTGRLLFGSGNGSLTSKAAGLTLIIVQFKTCFL